MSHTKAFLLLGLVFAAVLLLPSEVSAHEQAETTQTQGSVQMEKVEKANYHELWHSHGHLGKGHPWNHDKPAHGHPGHGDKTAVGH